MLIVDFLQLQVSDLDEVAMGTEERQSLEKTVEEMEEKVENCVRTQKDMFLVICQRMISVLTEHLSTCDQEGVDYETTWFLATLDNFRQLLVQVRCSSLLIHTPQLTIVSFSDPHKLKASQLVEPLMK